MSGTQSHEIAICEDWYKAFDTRNLKLLMKLFSDDPVVRVGAGGSDRCVPYHGTFVGRRAVEWYYRCRFEQKTQSEKDEEAKGNPVDPNRKMVGDKSIRNYCGFRKDPTVMPPWVIYLYTITDNAEVGGYHGPCLHVFRIETASETKIASLDMFLDPNATTVEAA